MSTIPLIAIDGPSGVGKSSTAKAVARALGWSYLDTGAMYRACALALRRAGTDVDDRAGLERVLAGLAIEQRGDREYLGGEDVSAAIRTPEISQMASRVSADPRVRTVLVAQQRRIGGSGNWVVDGRDIGTVVFPDACCKVFLTASVAARAQRRFKELEAKGAPEPLEQVTADIQRRDHADSTRAASPLRKADDAVELDSSAMTLEQVVDWIVARHRGHA
ncbi:MAG: (d)CMP kinase [Holophaga sp.]|jgi:cytidylate kinase